MRKYKLTNYTKKFMGVVVTRIQAVRNIEGGGINGAPGVMHGDLGGWVQHEGNLSHDGAHWYAILILALIAIVANVEAVEFLLEHVYDILK